ncbi:MULTISPECIES: AAA family ATPase [unclassified Streptomyces]|uniref:AAA family ATPase n=1 Tax=unclassified Streptomyces TaxID=2593676 RepID=UPI0013720CC8|nr:MULTISPECIES: AAA family ATPase [unclassified Streptomyces]MYY82132.1 AAA family ATPase [Streptomyces sp. SID335]MYZ16182.1 AAA family ATPase [Streptomyces sp. SID337]NEB48184.1 AAA family ATPase [Streptomyces sp. SID339]
MIRTLAVENYRSLRKLIVPLDRLNVITGANGTGKSSLYRSLRLFADSATGGAVAALAREGGLPSALWAGERKAEPTGLKLGFAGDEFGYAVDFGLPQSSGAGPGGSPSLFQLDPEIKRESTWAGPVLRPAALLCDRAGPAVRTRTADGGWHRTQGIRPYDSMLSEFADPQLAPDLLRLRELIRSWRFYDHVRTDADAPARAARIGTRTPVLAHDGADLAAALQTIREIGDDEALDDAVDDAFPGSRVRVVDNGGRFELQLHQHGLLRPLGPAELSDGTLRYLLWTAALLTPRPPSLLVLNEPETSLHPDLLRPLADLIVAATKDTQVVLVTHARPLAEAVAKGAARHRVDVNSIELTKESGQTTVAGRESLLDEPLWYWPKR